MTSPQTIEIPVKGMDCAECTVHVQQALSAVPGVKQAQVFLTSEKAILQVDTDLADLPTLRKAVESAGYTSPVEGQVKEGTTASNTFGNITRPILTIFALVFSVVLLIVVAGEWLGLLDTVTDFIPWPIGYALVLLTGYPIFLNVIRAALRRQIISHTLMTLGVIAALVIGQWPTAVINVFFMRVGEYAEEFTTERSRRAVKNLTAMAPQTARVEREGKEQEIPVAQVRVDEVVIVRPGEKIPVDGVVVGGQATINQAAITGESIPVEAEVGASVFAATVAQLGGLRVQAKRVGADTTFGRVIKMVEEAEAHRADVQRVADKFSAYFLPVVLGIAAVTFIISRNPLSVAAVLVVACSCSFALATPIAMLASIGAGAKRGLLIKGGRYLELLDKADVVLVDKTGTLTIGRPQLTNIVPLTTLSTAELLALAASAERYSEHPLAETVRLAAQQQQLTLTEPEQFEAVPGIGVKATVRGTQVTVGNYRILPAATTVALSAALEEQGKTLLYVLQDDLLVGVLGAADTLRPEVPAALEAIRVQGVKQVQLLTGDNERTAKALAEQLAISYRANLLPEDKIRVVKEYQAKGHTVVMIGDGVNDAPALAQADVGIAMGVAGTDVAIEAAHMVIMREDWRLVPEVFSIAHRTLRIVKMNFGFTMLYNLVGLGLAAFGLLPPVVAAAAQSLPDLGILANSSRLLKQRSLEIPYASLPISHDIETTSSSCACCVPTIAPGSNHLSASNRKISKEI
ncbi:MAG TPA: cation-translocating P-type ATPase [Chloroflexia bacterium]|nr:cation-translocating P-type ATPase [Chloroflexia bacterium]